MHNCQQRCTRSPVTCAPDNAMNHTPAKPALVSTVASRNPVEMHLPPAICMLPYWQLLSQSLDWVGEPAWQGMRIGGSCCRFTALEVADVDSLKSQILCDVETSNALTLRTGNSRRSAPSNSATAKHNTASPARHRPRARLQYLLTPSGGIFRGMALLFDKRGPEIGSVV